MQSSLPFRSFAVRLVPVLFACAPVMLPSPVHAQARTVADATIPFEFAIGKDKMPAGKYQVVRVAPNLLRLETADMKTIKNTLVYAVSAANAPEQGRLVFHRYGSQYFLANCWLANTNSGFQLVTSKAEKKTMTMVAARSPEAAGVEVALNVDAHR